MVIQNKESGGCNGMKSHHMSVNVIKTLVAVLVIMVMSGPALACRDKDHKTCKAFASSSGEVSLTVVYGEASYVVANPACPEAKTTMSGAYPSGYDFRTTGSDSVAHAYNMSCKFWREHPDGTAAECFLYLREMDMSDYNICVVKMTDGTTKVGVLPSYGGRFYLLSPSPKISEVPKGNMDKMKVRTDLKNQTAAATKAAKTTGKVATTSLMSVAQVIGDTDPQPVSGWNAGYNIKLVLSY